MATLNGKDVPQCVNCTQFKPDAKERTVEKDSGAVKRVLCDDCAAKVNETYPVSRETAKPEAKTDEPPAAKSNPIIKKK